jgi:hypothetical protein
MEAIGLAPPGPEPQIALNTAANRAYLLGSTPRNQRVQLVAVSGAMLQGTFSDATGQRFAVSLYRAERDRPVELAFYLAGATVDRVSVVGAVAAHGHVDPSGEAYVVTVFPYNERATVTLEYEVPSIPVSGGTLELGSGRIITVPSGAFTEAVGIHFLELPGMDTAERPNVDVFYELYASDPDTGETAELQPGQRYRITVTYDDGDVPDGVDEGELGLYYWDGESWVPEPTSTVNPGTNVVTAEPSHFSLWAILGKVRSQFLPSVLHKY